MDAIAANYIKPRTSYLTNYNASVTTNKRQSQAIFTGFARQVEAINQGYKTVQGVTAFQGTEGPALNNLKNGATWTSSQTLHAIQTTNYCANPGNCN